MFLWAQAGSAVPTWLSGKEFTCNVGGWGFDPWVEKIPWRRKWQPTPVFLPEKFHGKRSLLGYSPGDCKRVEHDLVNKQQQQPFNLIYPCFSPLPVPRWWPPFYSLLLCTQLSYVPQKSMFMQYFSCVWLILLSIMSSRSLQMAGSPYLLWLNNSPLCIHVHHIFIGDLGRFYALIMMDKSAMNHGGADISSR